MRKECGIYFCEITALNIHMLFGYSSDLQLKLPAKKSIRHQKFNNNTEDKMLQLKILFPLIFKLELGKTNITHISFVILWLHGHQCSAGTQFMYH